MHHMALIQISQEDKKAGGLMAQLKEDVTTGKTNSKDDEVLLLVVSSLLSTWYFKDVQCM